MADEDRFITEVKGAARQFRSIPKEKQIKIISHIDADGIAASAIIGKALIRDGRTYSLRVFQSVSDLVIQKLAQEEGEYYLFCDIGSAKLDVISKEFAGKTVFILDHHKVQGEKDPALIHLNPREWGVNGSLELSGAGVAYLFAKELNEKNIRLAHIALIGAIGDAQEKNGFFGMNQRILEDAQSTGILRVSKGLRLFGINSKHLHKVLEHSDHPHIPGVSGSEQGALQLLEDAGISPKMEGGWKKVIHLSDEEVQSLIAQILKRREGEENPEEILGNVYTLPSEKKGTPFRDLREFSTVLNACGRLGEVACGVGACLGDPTMKRKALDLKKRYKDEISKSLRIIENNKMYALTGDEYFVFNAEHAILPSIIGIVTSILAKGGKYPNGMIFIFMVRNPDDETTKISARIAGNNPKKRDLCNILKDIVHPIKGDYGGHAAAAGALIKSKDEDVFMETAVDVLKKLEIEEVL